MSIEQYAVHIAPRGGKIDLIVDQFRAERNAAYQKRMEYAQSKGAIGTYGNDHGVKGLLFPYTTPEDEWDRREATVPDGWKVTERGFEHAVAEPKAKDRTKVARDQTKALKAELAALPKMPGSWEFTSQIGGNQCIVGRSLLSCWCERIGETTFVFTPWATKRYPEGESLDEHEGHGKQEAFTPEGCERVGLSVYYAAKEAQEAVKV